MLNFSLPLFVGARCKSIAPYLVPFSENSLPARLHVQVARHLSQCPECRTEVQLLGQMSDFFRANPPEAASPSPNLWQSIEARIQVEPQDAPLLPLSRRVPVPVGFGWRGFVRGFAATGGVMTAAVAGVLFWVNNQPHPVTSSVAMKSMSGPGAREEISLTLRPTRKTLYAASTAESPITRHLTIPPRRSSAMMISPVRLASLHPSGSSRATLVARPAVSTHSAPLGIQVARIERNEGRSVSYFSLSVGSKVPLADAGPTSSNVRLSKSDDTAVGVHRIISEADQEPEVAEEAGALRFDPLHRASEMLDRSLSNAAVVAVAASLPAAPSSVNNENFDYRDQSEALSATSAPLPGVASGSRLMAKGTQVAWLPEDAPRSSRRSASEATSDLRRQQSLFSYGRR